MFDLLVFIGRFQPFHLGHLACIRKGLAESRHVLVLPGSAHQPRNVRNPFSVAERTRFIVDSVPAADRTRVTVLPLADAMYNDPVWIRNVHRAVHECLAQTYPGRPEAALRIGLVGHGKDRSSYYLRLFPTWGAVDAPNHEGVGATELRRLFLTSGFESGQVAPEVLDTLQRRLPKPVLEQLFEIARTPPYAELKAEQAFVQKYREQFAALKHPPTFNTADALVIQSGHILLVRRGARPGLGQLALPGGFVRQDETALDAAIRELRDETRLKVPEAVLRGSLTGRDTFDDPHRSVRGRTITQAFRFDLRPETALPRVKGGDDAKDAFWLPLARLDAAELFEDHWFIIQKMVGI